MGRVLVVEDDDRIAHLVGRALEHDGYSVVRAATGPCGLAIATDREFDLILLDLILPGMDGLEVLARVLRHRPEQLVLVLSARAEVGVRAACLEAGAAGFMGKPFAMAELLARVNATRPVRGGPTCSSTRDTDRPGRPARPDAVVG